MTLRDQIFIRTTPDQIFNFFEEMNRNYTLWHPDHILFKWTKGKGLKPGVEFYFEEKIGGKLMKKTVRFTKIEPNRYIEFEPVWWLMRIFMPRLAFKIEKSNNGCNFIAEIYIRTGPIGAWLNRREFNVVKKHMAEEGKNLKRILESRPSSQ